MLFLFCFLGSFEALAAGDKPTETAQVDSTFITMSYSFFLAWVLLTTASRMCHTLLSHRATRAHRAGLWIEQLTICIQEMIVSFIRTIPDKNHGAKREAKIPGLRTCPLRQALRRLGSRMCLTVSWCKISIILIKVKLLLQIKIKLWCHTLTSC